MPVTVKRRSNLGRIKDLNLLALVEPVLQESFEEIVAGIEANLSGGMIHARDAGGVGRGDRAAIDEWYEAAIVEGDRSRTIVVRVAPGIPTVLHEGVPDEWQIRATKASALHWIDKTGEDAFAKEVTHPPMPPRPFAREPVERVGRKIPQRVKEALAKRLAGGGG